MLTDPNAPDPAYAVERIPAKLARLHAISDILHNAGAPVRNASEMTTALDPYLDDILFNIVGSSTCRRSEFWHMCAIAAVL